MLPNIEVFQVPQDFRSLDEDAISSSGPATIAEKENHHVDSRGVVSSGYVGHDARRYQGGQEFGWAFIGGFFSGSEIAGEVFSLLRSAYSNKNRVWSGSG